MRPFGLLLYCSGDRQLQKGTIKISITAKIEISKPQRKKKSPPQPAKPETEEAPKISIVIITQSEPKVKPS